MGSMTEFAQFFALSFTALLPVINPLGSALVFLGMVGAAPANVYKVLARQIAFATALFLVAIDVAGAMVLKLFGISLPVVQLAGGLVLASMGWSLLNQKEATDAPDPSLQANDLHTLQRQIFYPFTFPITAGPGVLVVTLTLSAHASKGALLHMVFAQLGVLAGMALICLTVFVAYAWAPKITARISPSTAHGVLRVIAFILLCIGVQIAWKGLSSLLATLPLATR
jgi:multiple antibiotic resistance protein